MSISKKIKEYMTRASWIRKMFEIGAQLKAKYGEDQVIDYTIGNPILEPPEDVIFRLKELVNNPIPGMHRYMSNAGYESTRTAIANYLSEEFQKDFKSNHIVMTCGAAGAINVILRSILDRDDEVIIFSPYFVEYLFYIDNHNGKVKVVPTNEEFQIDLKALDDAINEKTKAIIICNPNNPTGVMYSQDLLNEVGELLELKNKKYNRTIYLISDEPYRKIIFDGLKPPSIFNAYTNSILVMSHSKDLALPGQRIGYIAVSPEMKENKQLIDALIFCNRTLGFVNAPALMQKVVESCQNSVVDIQFYQEKRDILYNELTKIGYKMIKPQGTFYIFPKSPIKDDVKFVNMALKEKMLLVPGKGFGCPGFFRISYCGINNEVVYKSIDIFKKLYEKAKEEEN